MQFSLEEIKTSQQIFYRLLEVRKITEDRDRELYYAYTGMEVIYQLVRQQAAVANCQIERYGDSIYLIPHVDNEILGFSKRELKAKLCRSGATDKDFYLSQFVVLTLLVEFYDSQGASSKSRTFMRVGDLQNLISERLKEGATAYSEDEQADSGIAFSNMLEAFAALKSDERGSRAKTTKEGFLHHIFKFLQDQELIDYIEVDEMIKTTDKLDRFMDFNLLNKNHFHRVLNVLGGNVDEQD